MLRDHPGNHRLPALVAVMLTVLSAVASPSAEAQEEALVTDRPDFTESTASVRPGRWQIETGYTYEEVERQELHNLGEALLRIGLTELVELRLELPSYVDQSGPLGDARGLGDAAIGFKLETAAGSDEPRFLEPAMALLVSTTLPTGDSEIGEPHLQPSVLLALDWAVSDRLGVGSNVGLSYASADGEQFAEASFSVALGADLRGDWGGFLEYFAFFPESAGGDPTHFVDGGVTYLLSNDFQLDLRLGTEIGGETDLFAGVGLAYRW